jgi:hypothetical protein
MTEKKKHSTLTEHNTRHTISIKIQENVKTEFPDVGGALVSVEHSREIYGDPDETEFTDKVDMSDLLNVAMNLIATTVIESDMSEEVKLAVTVRACQDIMGQVLSHVIPSPECMGCDHDLTPEQKASMQLFMSNPLNKFSMN